MALDSFPDAQPSRRPTRRQAVDVIAVLLVVAGLFGLVAAAWEWDPRLGVAVGSAFAIAAGVLLGTER